MRESFISISLDGWDSNSGKVLGAVAHYLSPSLQPKRHLLSVEPLNTNSTGPLLAASLKIQLQQKKLEKISALVSDNGGNYLNIASLLSVPGWNCSCHTLQLVVNEGLKGEFFFLFLFFLSLVFFFLSFFPHPFRLILSFSLSLRISLSLSLLFSLFLSLSLLSLIFFFLSPLSSFSSSLFSPLFLSFLFLSLSFSSFCYIFFFLLVFLKSCQVWT